ncbi:MAG: hypothetical protein WBC21_01345 [Minisyncoccales bacterium]
MTETKIEVKDLFLRYRDHNGNDDEETKTTKELTLARAIIVLDERGSEREIMVPRNKIGKLPDIIEVVSMLYIESKPK